MVSALIPYIHAANPQRSVAFYGLLGFELIDRNPECGAITWAFLRHNEDLLMIALADAPIDASAQAVMFSLWAPNLQTLREHLHAHHVTVGEIQHPDHAPNGQFRIEDPDGYVLWARQTAKTPQTLQE